MANSYVRHSGRRLRKSRPRTRKSLKRRSLKMGSSKRRNSKRRSSRRSLKRRRSKRRSSKRSLKRKSRRRISNSRRRFKTDIGGSIRDALLDEGTRGLARGVGNALTGSGGPTDPRTERARQALAARDANALAEEAHEEWLRGRPVYDVPGSGVRCLTPEATIARLRRERRAARPTYEIPTQQDGLIEGAGLPVGGRHSALPTAAARAAAAADRRIAARSPESEEANQSVEDEADRRTTQGSSAFMDSLEGRKDFAGLVKLVSDGCTVGERGNAAAALARLAEEEEGRGGDRFGGWYRSPRRSGPRCAYRARKRASGACLGEPRK